MTIILLTSQIPTNRCISLLHGIRVAVLGLKDGLPVYTSLVQSPRSESSGFRVYGLKSLGFRVSVRQNRNMERLGRDCIIPSGHYYPGLAAPEQRLIPFGVGSARVSGLPFRALGFQVQAVLILGFVLPVWRLFNHLSLSSGT